MNYKKPAAAMRHMDIMAESVVKVMCTGMPLRTVVVGSSKTACSLVVGIDNSSQAVFTSWHTGTDIDGRWRESHVSLGVKLTNFEDMPLLDTIEWVNGLVFFKQREKISVTFRWPRVWMESKYQ